MFKDNYIYDDIVENQWAFEHKLVEGYNKFLKYNIFN